MTFSLLVWAVLAIAFFWGVGAYNRLMRMRAKGNEALGNVDRYLQRYGALIDAHLDQSVEGAVPDEWKSLLTNMHVLGSACNSVKLLPLNLAAVNGLEAAYKDVQASWAALMDVPNDLAGSRIPEGLKVEWERITQKVVRARNIYHQIATDYNTALTQFPANLLARVAGLQVAGTL